MKKFAKSLFLLALVLVYSCSDDELDVSNPNDPTFDALQSETGLTQLATGTYNTATFDVAWGFYWVVNAYHEAMGDAMYIPWGNFGFRWVNQPTSITLDDGTIVTPPQEGAQGAALEVRNQRTQTSGNAFAWEWESMYRVNNTSNLLLSLVDETELSGNADVKRAVFRAWAYYWKGYAYSRLGSMYTAGLILDEPGVTSGDFVPNTDILAEAKRNLDLAKAELEQISIDIGSFTSSIIPNNLVPSPFRGSSAGVTLTKDGWIRGINTLLARNILANNKVADMTAADWMEISNLTNKGLQASDYVFVMKQDGNNWETNTTVNHRFLVGWHFLSERLVQDFKPGDQRFEDNIVVLSAPEVNRSGRGIQYGTRFGYVDGDYATTEDNKANVYYAGTYEENELMQAEALIYSGQIDQGLAIIDGVREHQLAGLDAVSGTGLNLDEALEELRVERRIGLLMRGVAFYDARRWNITKTPRAGLTVLDGSGSLNTNATFNYNYLDYWSIPDQELEFNQPNEGTAPVVSPN
jgi:hypothetical protein